MDGFFVRFLSASMALMIFFSAFSSSDAASPQRGRIQTLSYDFEAAGKRMTYTLYVPTSYRADTPTPLVVALHGLFSNPRQIIRYPGLTRLAERYGFIVVAPMGYNTRGWYGSETFASKVRPSERFGDLSEKDVMNVLGIVRNNYTIDSSRIYLMGHSMGGGGAWHLSIKHPELFAAIAPIAPAIYRPADQLETIKHLPVIVVQGVRDPSVDVNVTRRWVAKMQELGMNHRYIEDPNGGHVFIAFRNLPEIFQFFDEHRKPSPTTNNIASQGMTIR